ncbi:hypothetical protein TUM17377_27180 [Shewanella chilikensis]|nr:hypothetical protein TUM17377_27180 [Shewanella chilikensis]
MYFRVTLLSSIEIIDVWVILLQVYRRYVFHYTSFSIKAGVGVRDISQGCETNKS